ncbi:hypothetical protein PV726_23165 [Streptomyces europaeiscabiei]|uniref:hypothetical protein n=1 Tax=Streptomyces europaeiscabiei TaxID=146819 RepID=UPI0029A9A1D3|nr:hypothetical protein [Streptomyces europaeiscabiei]MDX3693193.1 hypothetical protein [Streptomyces europaeiscabiei]
MIPTPTTPTSPMDQLLARALLLEAPHVPHDVVPGARCQDSLLPLAGHHDGTSTMAARDLRTLCETVLAHTTSDSLQDFVTEHLPEPPGARVLGCILQLADAEDSARSWWQYAAGAGDDLASYCLYLHHLILGDTEAAAWWREQTKIATRPAPEFLLAVPDPGIPTAYDASFPTVLRALSHLDGTTPPRRTELVDAVMHYVPGAVALGYVDNPDFELPLPGPDFAEHLTVLVAATSATASWGQTPSPRRPVPRPPVLPRREAGVARAPEGRGRRPNSGIGDRH